MFKTSFIKAIPMVMSLVMLTSCNNLEQSNVEQVTTVSNTTEAITTIDENALIPFNDFEVSENNGEYFVTINQEGLEDCYYTISLLYGNKVIEYVSGDGFKKSAYGEFADGDTLEGNINIDTDDDDDNNYDEDVTTVTEETTIPIENLLGKDGKWTFKCVSEGTEYIEIKLINSFGDVRSKCQYTCIVDTHLEAHLYYTNINY
ncbi:MAG: hypothetical protein ACI4WH_03150 [Oscillospiraceae bacterium]